MLNKLRIIFGISIIMLIICRIIVPGYREMQREKKVTDNDVQKYRDHSVDIKLSHYEKLLNEDSTEVYFDGAPFVKKYSTKETTLLKDITTGNIYKLELYHPQSFIDIGKNDENLWVSVNHDEFKNRKGNLKDPFIVLQYGFGESKNSLISPEKYDYSIKEYLTYKNYTPPIEDFVYYLNMAWVFITIAGFSVTTGLSIQKERAEKRTAHFGPSRP